MNYQLPVEKQPTLGNEKNFNFEEKKEKENAEVKEDTAIAAS